MKAEGLVNVESRKIAASLDVLQALTGLGLALFMFAHTLFVFSVVFGSKVFDSLAAFFESTGLAQAGGVGLGAVFLLHFILAARKIPFTSQEQRIFKRHVLQLNHLDTWLWLVQVISGMIILLLGSIHIWVILNDLPITAIKSKTLVQQGLWVYFNLLFLFCVALHLGIGLYRIGVKWGFILRANRGKMQKIMWGIIGMLVGLDLISLIAFYFF